MSQSFLPLLKVSYPTTILNFVYILPNLFLHFYIQMYMNAFILYMAFRNLVFRKDEISHHWKKEYNSHEHSTQFCLMLTFYAICLSYVERNNTIQMLSTPLYIFLF